MQCSDSLLSNDTFKTKQFWSSSSDILSTIFESDSRYELYVLYAVFYKEITFIKLAVFVWFACFHLIAIVFWKLRSQLGFPY